MTIRGEKNLIRLSYQQLFNCIVLHQNYICKTMRDDMKLGFQLLNSNNNIKVEIKNKNSNNFVRIQSKRNSILDKNQKGKFGYKLEHKKKSSKTEAVERTNKYELPEINISKNPLVQMQFNEVQLGSKIILNSNKNTKILNQMIQILRQDCSDTELLKKKKSSKIPIKKMLTQSPDNQFFEEYDKSEKSGPVFQRGPKLFHPEIINFYDNKLKSKRNIYSQQKSRPRPKIKRSLNFNIGSTEQNPNNVTFYKPSDKIKKQRQGNEQAKQYLKNVFQKIDMQF